MFQNVTPESVGIASEKVLKFIKKYFGNMSMEFGFKEDKVGIFMTKNAEAFLEEYHGYANGRRIEKRGVY